MVNVVETTNQPVYTQATGMFSQIPWDLVINISIISVLVMIVLGLIYWIVLKIYKKIKDIRKKKEDLEYYKYTMDLKMCHLNSDKHYRKKKAWTLWLFWKKADVYAVTELGRKFIGKYDGEAVKKEGFFLLSLEQKHSIFSSETDVVIFPYEISKQIVRRNDDFTIDLHCEGIDEVMSSEYYSIPVFKNTGKDKKKIFADFSNMVMKDFFQEYVYRNVIKEQTKEYSDTVKEATEMNPNIQYARKDNSNLKN